VRTIFPLFFRGGLAPIWIAAQSFAHFVELFDEPLAGIVDAAAVRDGAPVPLLELDDNNSLI
jgi:hypothetical protein